MSHLVTQFSRSFLNVLAFLPLPPSVALACYMQRAVSLLSFYIVICRYVCSPALNFSDVPAEECPPLCFNSLFLLQEHHFFMSPQLIRRKKRPKIHKESSKKTQMYPPQSKSGNDGGGLHRRQNVSVARGDAQGFPLGAGGTVPAVTRHLSPEEV